MHIADIEIDHAGKFAEPPIEELELAQIGSPMDHVAQLVVDHFEEGQNLLLGEFELRREVLV